MKITFLKSGLFTSIQDFGRMGLEAFGVPRGGVMDRKSASQANQLVGNSEINPVFEITLLGPTIIFDDNCQIAITGADISPKLNQIPISVYQTISVSKGDTLSFGRLKKGCRAYLAIGGNWKIEKELGSFGLLFQGKIIKGQRGKMEKGRVIEIEKNSFIDSIQIVKEDQLKIENPQIIKVLPGPEFHWFSSFEIALFFSEVYQLSRDCNRMGCKLDGYALHRDSSKELISSGIIPGTIQITNQGLPVVLLADAQTSGGYPRIANIVSSDIDLMGQLKPGDKIRFVMVKK